MRTLEEVDEVSEIDDVDDDIEKSADSIRSSDRRT
jgi:hypothetical protein